MCIHNKSQTLVSLFPADICTFKWLRGTSGHLRAHKLLTSFYASVAHSTSNSLETNDSGCPLHSKARASMTQGLTSEPSNSITLTPLWHSYTHTQWNTHTHNQAVQKQTWHDRSAALPNPCLCFFSLHLTGDSPQFRIFLARQVDVTCCPPDRLIWINSAEETGRGGKICLHYDRKRGDGNQPRGSFLYARLIKCLTAPVDGITDYWTKSEGVKAGGNESVFVQLGLDSCIFRGLTALGLWQACCTSSPTYTKCELPPSPSLRTAEGSVGIRGQTWRKMAGKKKAQKTTSKRKKGELVRG